MTFSTGQTALKAEYLSLPDISPYSKITQERIRNPKENFKLVAKTIRGLGAVNGFRIADVGCANGELIHYLRSQFPAAYLHGFDREAKFIAIAEALGVPRAQFSVADLKTVTTDESFDFVICVGTVPIFTEPQDVLLPLLSLCKPGGYVLADGFFNKNDCEVRVQFCDNSTPQGQGKWRADFTHHSRTLIRNVLEPHCSSVEFLDIDMGVDIPRKDGVPHANVWTFKDESGRRRITSGLNLLLDGTLVVARKL